MKIEISAAFETSHTANYRPKITAKIVRAQCRATAKEAVSRAQIRFQQQLDNARDVVHKSGLV
jgi:hypothetical protein